jgi:hypothetical protein
LVLRYDQDNIAAKITADDSATESETESDREVFLASLQKQKARQQLACPQDNIGLHTAPHAGQYDMIYAPCSEPQGIDKNVSFRMLLMLSTLIVFSVLLEHLQKNHWFKMLGSRESTIRKAQLSCMTIGGPE